MPPTSHLTRLSAIATGLAVLAVVLVACSGSDPVTTEVLPSSTAAAPSTTPTTTGDPDAAVIFGSGSIPETVPSDFPIPTEAVIGSTLVDRNRNITEMIIRVPAGVEALAAFFDANLPGRGYDVTTSSGDSATWDIGFSDDVLTGTIAITLGGEAVSQAVVTLTMGA